MTAQKENTIQKHRWFETANGEYVYTHFPWDRKYALQRDSIIKQLVKHEVAYHSLRNVALPFGSEIRPSYVVLADKDSFVEHFPEIFLKTTNLNISAESKVTQTPKPVVKPTPVSIPTKPLSLESARPPAKVEKRKFTDTIGSKHSNPAKLSRMEGCEIKKDRLPNLKNIPKHELPHKKRLLTEYLNQKKQEQGQELEGRTFP